ncbi:MAG: c-type cytochrome biogenesis protein CcsB [Actinomycetota bacterium]|nr:MAG: c-type cytochrome biogenesis protein CcsB [Actinomycetota bacterium]
MLVLAGAMVCFAAFFAAGRSRTAPVAVTAQVPVGAAVGAPAAVVGSAPGTAVARRAQPDADALPPGRRVANVGMSLTWLGWALLVAGLVVRGIWAGRAPWGNMYEFSLSSAAVALTVFLGISTRRDVRWLGLFVVVPVLLTIGLAVTVLYTEAAQLVPALKSYWLVIHVLAAIISGAAFLVTGAVSMLYLVRERAERRAGPDGVPTGPISSHLPTAERLDAMAYRIIAFTFPLWTFAVIAGAIWAENAWGRYWGWDPKETWAFVTWVVFAAYLHARATAGWRGRRAAYIALAGFATFVINYFAVNIFASGLHSYGGLS